MEIALCVLVVIMGFTPVVVASYKANKAEKVAARLVTLHPATGMTVYPSTYSTTHTPLVEFDINGYFTKENK